VGKVIGKVLKDEKRVKLERKGEGRKDSEGKRPCNGRPLFVGAALEEEM